MNNKTLKLVKRLQKLVEQQRKIDQFLISERCMELTIDDRSDAPSMFLWRHLQRPNKGTLSLLKEYEYFHQLPECSLACLLELESGQQNLSHAAITVHQSEDNKLNYCISGSISLDELQKICEYHLLENKTRK